MFGKGKWLYVYAKWQHNPPENTKKLPQKKRATVLAYIIVHFLLLFLFFIGIYLKGKKLHSFMLNTNQFFTFLVFFHPLQVYIYHLQT